MTNERRPLQPVLILCAPRSCSTVVCAMFGRHPRLYGFPELNLFLTDRLGELEQLATATAPGSVSYWTGLLRAVAELRFGGQSSEAMQSARSWVTARRDWTTKRTLEWLLEAVHPRIGVDKSPRTCLSIKCIGRALAAFPRARLVHLTRHPVATLRSLVQAHLSAAPTAALSRDQSRLAGFYAGLWLQAQESILAALEGRDSGLTTRIRAEDILREPASHLVRMGDWLKLPSDPESIAAMLHPENSPYACLPPGNLAGDGDPGFQRSPALRRHDESQSHLQWPDEWHLDPELQYRLDVASRMLGYGSLL